MTVSTTSCRVVLGGNGSTTDFPTGFRVDAAADLIVTYTDADGNDTVITSGQYTTDGHFGSAYPNGPTITYAPGGTPIATGTTLTLERSIAATQPSAFSNQGALWPSAIEGSMDRIVMLLQGFIDQAQRSLRVPATDADDLSELPNATDRADSVLGFDADGQPYAAVFDTSAVAWAAWVISSFATQATSAANARTALQAVGLVGNETIAGDKTITGDNTYTGPNDFQGNVFFVTQAVGYDGLRGANAAFVQAAIATVTGVADANTAPTDASRTIVFTSLTASRTVTLPAASSCRAGRRLLIIDGSGSASSTVTISLVPTGSDTIAGSNTTQVCINVKNGRCIVNCDGASKWFVEAWDVVYEAFATGDTSSISSTFLDVTGVTVAQGTAGTWEVEAGCTMLDTAGAAALFATITDGTTNFVAAGTTTYAASALASLVMRARAVAPAASLKLQAKDTTAGTGVAKFNASGASKDTYIRARRVA